MTEFRKRKIEDKKQSFLFFYLVAVISLIIVL